jgi:hypothetical protein
MSGIYKNNSRETMPFLKTKTAVSSHTQTLLMDNINRVRPIESRLRWRGLQNNKEDAVRMQKMA